MKCPTAPQVFPIALSLLACAGAAPAAHAQRALEEVIVTAQKRDDSLQEVPMTVNAVTAAMIEEYNLLDFKDLAQFAPGLTIEAGSARSANVSLRGIQVNPDAAAGVAVSIYWNEVVYDIDSAFKAMYDVGQLEVLRGPQGTLRGITAPAGAITIATRRPNYRDIDGYAQQTFSDRDLSNTQFGASLPLIEDRLALRIAGVYDQKNGGDVVNAVTGTHESVETRSGRLTLGFRPLDELEANLVYQQIESDADSFLNQLVGTGNSGSFERFDRRSATDFDGYSNGRRDIASLNVAWELDGHELVYIGGYQRLRLRSLNDLDTGNALPGQAMVQDVATHNVLWSHELRFASTDADFYNYTYGLYYSNNATSTDVAQPQLLQLTAGDPVYVSVATPIDINNEGIAAFMSHEFQISADTGFQFGLRYQKQRTATDSGLTARYGTWVAASLAEDFTAVDEAVTGSASISHQLTDDVRIYANYGRSFRPSGRLPVPANPPLEAGTWDPETSDSIELGFKSRLNDGRLQLNGALFYQKFHDFIARAAYIWTNNSRAGVLNNSYGFNYSANVIVQGAELSADALLTDQWKLGASVSYTDSKYDDAQIPCNVFDAAGAPVLPDPGNAAAYGVPLSSTGEYFACGSNGRLGSEPNWMASLSSEYVWPLAGGYESFARGLYTFRGGRAFDTVRNGDTPSYGLLNAYLGVRNQAQGWELSLWAKNLFDREAITSVTDPIQLARIIGGPIATGYYSVQVIPAREFGVTGIYHF